MPQVTITIGGRSFSVACQPGEEEFLQTAASLLDTEATTLNTHMGRMPEAQLLLMSGLMLADKTVAMQEQMRVLELENSELRSRIDELEARPSPEPQRVEVPVVPLHVTETLMELAAQAEALADAVEDRGQA